MGNETIRNILVLIVLTVMVSAGSAFAEDLDLSVGGETGRETGLIGLGVAAVPDYEGSDDYEGAPLLIFKYQWKSGRNVTLLGNALRANLVASTKWNAGPIIRFRGTRDDDVESTAVAKMKEIDSTVEAGAFASVRLDNWMFMASVLTDASDAHDGTLFELKGNYTQHISDKTALIYFATANYASSDYMSTYFGVDGPDSAASGLPVYDAESGLKDVGAGLAVLYDVSKKWQLLFVGKYSSLLGDAEDSPVVDQEGDSNQFLGGFAVSYRF